MPLRILVSRHSAFYSPLIATVAGDFLKEHGLSAEYGVLGQGQRSSDLIREGQVDVMQSAVSTSWRAMDRGETGLPVHFAQINRRDGFFLVARNPSPAFRWELLEGSGLVADHAFQPLAMLRFAACMNGVDWKRVVAIDSGDPDAMVRAFRQGTGNFVHLQSPAAHQLVRDGVGRVVASVGESMPPVAFSSLCCSREFLATDNYKTFLEAYKQAREWVRTAPAEDVGEIVSTFFPGFTRSALADAIRTYQRLGCWDGGVAIPRDLYETALNVFETAGQIQHRHAYGEVCVDA